MPTSTLTARAALLAALLAGCAAKGPASPAPPPVASAATPAAVEADPTTPEGLLPGIPLDNLTDAQKQLVADFAQDEFCYCGCPHTVSQCLRTHGGCHHAKRMARLASRLAAAGVTKAELLKLVTAYYASFDRPRRARLDVTAFGPPQGDPAAPVTVVEFSDFTCPYCQLLRPSLEKFVADRKGRLKLFYKPFPIESHPNAVEAAQAGEWARDQGKFWDMHDVLFTSPHAVSPPELVGYARDLGLDGEALRAALESGTYKTKVSKSQAEARDAGIKGTPSLFFDGRMLTVPDLSDWMLEFTLQDEEEWQAGRAWARDEAH
jgi:protein-disulfide isomerase